MTRPTAAPPRDEGAASAPVRLPMAYVLPLRAHDDGGLDELTGYLRELSRWVDVVVVDGSAPELFARHAEAWRGLVRHVPPDPALRGRNGKVLGVLTGVALARHEHVVIADDDVRYDRAALCAVHQLLDGVDLVRPQNHFDPLPWHAWWDTGRTLLARVFGGDWPGTLGVRRSTFLAMGGYDPDVLFENLELVRTVRAYGGSTATPAWLYVRGCRRPPRTSSGSASARRTTRRPGRCGCSPRWRCCRGRLSRSPPAGPGCCCAPGWRRWPWRSWAGDGPAAPGSSRRTRAWRLPPGCWNAACARGWRWAGGCAAACPTRAPGCGRRPTPHVSCAGG
ncbi:glycosyltransferase [Micromonospora aurantiaca (nom. illeg.)]|uniref:glycosyltransferase n=1 Tax=Micromonospora aurantiaca (nom. illeg.) TaxID=47850 RepID=UPI0037AC0230